MTDTNAVKSALSHIQNFIGPNSFRFKQTASSVGINLNTCLSAANKVSVNANQLGTELMDVFRNWSELQQAASLNNMDDGTLRKLVVSIEEVDKAIPVFQSGVNDLNTVANNIIGKLNAAKTNLQNSISQDQYKISNLHDELNSTAQAINNINSELSGSSGFGQGFLPGGISAGIYLLGLRDKLSNLQKLWTTYDSELTQLNSTIATKNEQLTLLSQVDTELRTIICIYSDLSGLENTLNNLNQIAQKTEHDGEVVTGSSNETVVEIFVPRFSKDMESLLNWKGVFPY